MKNIVIKMVLFIFLLLCFMQVFAQKTYPMGLNFDDVAYKQIPVKKAELKRRYQTLPPKADLKPYCPTPQMQGEKSTCVGWAVGYAACTITEGVAKNITDKTQLNDMASSADFVYAYGKKAIDTECSKGIEMDITLPKLYGRMIPRKKDFRMVCSTTTLPVQTGTGVKIMQHTRLFKDEDAWDFKLDQVKKALSDKKPVVIGIDCSKSFFETKEVWNGNTSDFKGGHALCIIGYDDTFQNGAVEVMNSWGTEWGKSGFGWIKYADLQGALKYAYEINTDCSTEQTTPTQVIKSPELITNISLRLATGQEIPIILNTNGSNRGLKPIKENNTVSNTLPSVSTPINAISNRETQYKTVQPYTSGTRYRVYIDISQPIYLYVLGSDLTGQVSALFPPNETISPYLSNKNTAIALPDEQWFVEMDDNKGKDFMLFLYSPTPLSMTNIISELNNEKGAFLEKINKNLGSKLQFIDNNNLNKNIIHCQLPLNNEVIQAICLEIEHQ